MLAKLIVEVQDTQEILNKQKTDNNVRHQNNTAGVSKLLRILVHLHLNNNYVFSRN